MNLRKVISIDPGVYIGYATWEAGRFKRGVLTHPLEYGFIHNKDLEKTFYQFKKYIAKNSGIRYAYMENSVLMKKGKGIVAAESGALVKLSQTIGRITQILVSFGIKVELIPVAKWKGSLPKKVCEHRIRRLLPRLRENEADHTIDAIGIGLHKMGRF